MGAQGCQGSPGQGAPIKPMRHIPTTTVEVQTLGVVERLGRGVRGVSGWELQSNCGDSSFPKEALQDCKNMKLVYQGL